VNKYVVEAYSSMPHFFITFRQKMRALIIPSSISTANMQEATGQHSRGQPYCITSKEISQQGSKCNSRQISQKAYTKQKYPVLSTLRL
jgi:hypothetical protein